MYENYLMIRKKRMCQKVTTTGKMKKRRSHLQVHPAQALMKKHQSREESLQPNTSLRESPITRLIGIMDMRQRVGSGKKTDPRIMQIDLKEKYKIMKSL